jgi:hypothetical protein
MSTVLYMITTGTRLSGSEGRYRTAHDATMAAASILSRAFYDRSVPASTQPGVNIVVFPSFNDHVVDHVGLDNSREIDPSNPATYDVYIDIGTPAFRVYAKVYAVKTGNTAVKYKTVTTKTGVVPAGGTGEYEEMPTYTSFSLLTQGVSNPDERIRMDAVHMF